MLIEKRHPNPIPYVYGYPQRQSGALVYNFGARPPALGDDPGWNTRGEAALYHDTQLGAPNLMRRWRARFGLRDAAAPVAATTDDVIALMNAHQDRVFALTVVSTTAVAVSALLTVFRTLKLIRSERR